MNSKGMMLFLGLLFAGSLQAQISIYESINQAGRQRMLSQRIAKAYLYAGLDTETEAMQEELQATAHLFEEQHLRLKEYAPTAQVREALEAVEGKWAIVETLIAEEATKDKAAQLLDISNDLLAASQQVVVLLEQYAATLPPKEIKVVTTNSQEQSLSPKELAALVNNSGRQRMLSQRIALYHAAKVWKLSHPSIDNRLNIAMKEYKEMLYELFTAKNPAEIERSLGLVVDHWKVVQETCKAEKSSKDQLSTMLKHTGNLLEIMENVTGLYEGLAVAQR